MIGFAKIIVSTAIFYAVFVLDVLCMNPVFHLRLAGLIVIALIAAGHAYAFSDGGDESGSTYTAPRDEPSSQRPSDYTYTGNTFNFSMSKDASQSTAEGTQPDSTAMKPEPAQTRRPGILKRLFRGIFGSN